MMALRRNTLRAKAGSQHAWQSPSPPTKTPLPPVFPHRWACAYGEDEFGLWEAFEVKGVRQVLRWIPPGEFWMGSPETEALRFDNEVRHHVTLTQGYWLADTACPQALWEAVVGENPSGFKGDPNLPVERVSWNDVQEKFLPALNRLVPGLEAQLPSEAQW
jgi:formylglycine-generating enzyme required for sulfatase activity